MADLVEFVQDFPLYALFLDGSTQQTCIVSRFTNAFFYCRTVFSLYSLAKQKGYTVL
jgi:hypothetical protein